MGTINLGYKKCPDKFKLLGDVGEVSPVLACARTIINTDPPHTCPAVPNPVYAETGLKRQREDDFIDPAGRLNFARTWRSDQKRFITSAESGIVDGTQNQQTSGGCYPAYYPIIWNVSHYDYGSYCFPYIGSGTDEIQRISPDGNRNIYKDTGSALISSVDVNDKLTRSTDVNGQTQWIVTNEDNSTEIYDSKGLIQFKKLLGGETIAFQYSNATTLPTIAPRPGLLISISDGYGRNLAFTYNNDGNIVTLTDPAKKITQYNYDEATGNCPSLVQNGNCQRLTSVAYPDGKKRIYHYNETGHIDPSISLLQTYLTGITDENGIRYATYSYDAQGRTIISEHAGDADRYQLSYSTDGSNTVVTDPLGSQYTHQFQTILGVVRSVGQSRPAGSGCAASLSALTYDANGNVASADDFNAHRTCYVSDLTRNLETARVEGLPNTQACTTVTPPNATLPANSRKTSTEWHPDWRLAIKVAEPGKFTTYVYNGQPDPLSGGAIASCAPSTALLPDGKPIAVLCHQVEQATTDADGHLGFTAALQAGVPKREQKWTYNDFGQVLTHDGPRTDMADITTYAYYYDTGTDHTMGDLQSVTNALGQVTNYTKYNPHGQLLESIDPNGVVTTQTYDLRQRLLSTNVNGHTTSYTYDAAGQLLKVTAPDASWIGYEYDPAHRLVATKDNLGNRIDYTLDNAGNRTAEAVKDPGGALRRQLSRSIDALGRIQQITGRE